MTVDIQKLKALAERVPNDSNIWHATEERESSNYQGYIVVDNWQCHVASTGMENNDGITADFIAAANPAAVLELIAEIERLKTLRSKTERDLEQELEVWRHGPFCWNCGDTGDVHNPVGEWLGECDCLAAQLIGANRNIDQLKTDNTDLHATLQAAKGEIERLKGENEALRKDAERYRWLRKNTSVIFDRKTAYQAETGFIKFDTMPARSEMETAIDAAMSKEADHD